MCLNVRRKNTPWKTRLGERLKLKYIIDRLGSRDLYCNNSKVIVGECILLLYVRNKT
jgi:hypothetical protein